MATQARGTHPTGMHSCVNRIDWPRNSSNSSSSTLPSLSSSASAFFFFFFACRSKYLQINKEFSPIGFVRLHWVSPLLACPPIKLDTKPKNGFTISCHNSVVFIARVAKVMFSKASVCPMMGVCLFPKCITGRMIIQGRGGGRSAFLARMTPSPGRQTYQEGRPTGKKTPPSPPQGNTVNGSIRLPVEEHLIHRYLICTARQVFLTATLLPVEEHLIHRYLICTARQVFLTATLLPVEEHLIHRYLICTARQVFLTATLLPVEEHLIHRYLICTARQVFLTATLLPVEEHLIHRYLICTARQVFLTATLLPVEEHLIHRYLMCTARQVFLTAHTCRRTSHPQVFDMHRLPGIPHSYNLTCKRTSHPQVIDLPRPPGIPHSYNLTCRRTSHPQVIDLPRPPGIPLTTTLLPVEEHLIHR